MGIMLASMGQWVQRLHLLAPSQTAPQAPGASGERALSGAMCCCHHHVWHWLPPPPPLSPCAGGCVLTASPSMHRIMLFWLPHQGYGGRRAPCSLAIGLWWPSAKRMPKFPGSLLCGWRGSLLLQQAHSRGNQYQVVGYTIPQTSFNFRNIKNYWAASIPNTTQREIASNISCCY